MPSIAGLLETPEGRMAASASPWRPGLVEDLIISCRRSAEGGMSFFRPWIRFLHLQVWRICSQKIKDGARERTPQKAPALHSTSE